MCFAELRAVSAFSFGDGAATPEAMARAARRLGYHAVGLTDAADLGGIVRFATECVVPARDAQCLAAAKHDDLGDERCATCERVIQPIVGSEIVVDEHPLAFLVRDQQGYRNLAGLVTAARVGQWDRWDKQEQHGRRGRARISWEQMAARSEGLHALTGGPAGALAARVRSGDEFGARRLLRSLRDVFADRLAVEVQLHHVGGHESALATELIALAEREGVPWVVTHAPRYLDGAGRLLHDVLTALRHDTDVDTALRRGLLHPNGEWRLVAPHDMRRRWKGREEGLRQSLIIAEECSFDLRWMRPPLPRFAVPDGHDDDSFLRECTYAGARERWGTTLSMGQMRQLEHELDIIRKLGFAGFFLVMWDAIRFTRRRGILAQGRGSAANSAVAYCLGVTAVDPVKHGLLFERFLSEVRADGRAEAPDIDVDIEHDRREEVLDYMYDHYGRGHAAIACIVQTYRAPNAIQDAMRAFGYPAEQAFALSKRLHWSEPKEGADAIRDGLGAAHGVDVTDARGKTLLDAIAAFENLPRLRATHVGGFVLSADPLGDWLPIEQTTMGRTIIQFDKDDLDALGVPKFDFLGLGGLSLVRRAFDVLERRTGTRPTLYGLPYDDAKTYELIQRGDTIGTFQIESRAQIASILHTKPERLYDIVVQVALIRPGPIQAKFVSPYTARRLGQERVTYAHPALEPILARTQGIPIFQEQAMAISMALAGYSGSEADELRRCMGNERKRLRLVRALDKLGAAMIRRGIDEPVARKICEDLVSFANYGFPESHAWSFALIAYATSWLKAHHPAEFFLGLLNSWPMGFYPVSTLIHDARRGGVEVRPPCLKHGDWECTVEETADPCRPALRIGWRHVRGVGQRVIDALRAARERGPFEGVRDVVSRASLARADALALARAGAFATWAPDRRQAAWEALHATGDVLPLAPAPRAQHASPPMDPDRLVLLDYYATGLSLNGHPVQSVRERLSRWGAVDSRQLEGIDSGRTVLVGGLITVRQRPATAGGTIFLLLEDEHGFLNVIVPRQLVEANAEVVKHSTAVVVQGRLEKDGAVINVVGRRFKALELGVTHTPHSFR